MQCTNPFTLVDQGNMIVPCGKCIACRIKKRQEWAMRMLHERSVWKDSVFITLTYDDLSMPFGLKGLPTLRKAHLQKFMKRLRYYLAKDDRKIKYFACGEYGEETERPHYHAIIFGMSQFGDDRCLIKGNWPYCDWKNSSIERFSFGCAEADSIRYVSQYIDKKYNGSYADEIYGDLGREPVFKLASNGIGREWCICNEDNIIDVGNCTMNGVPLSIPRYYIDLLGMDISEQKKEAREKEELIMRSILGADMTLEEVYRYLSTAEVKRVDCALKKSASQRDKDLSTKVDLKRSKKI